MSYHRSCCNSIVAENYFVNYLTLTDILPQILATTTARRLAVIDVEKGEQILSYDNCKYYNSVRNKKSFMLPAGPVGLKTSAGRKIFQILMS